MWVLWHEIKYLEYISRLLNRKRFKKRGLELSKEVLWVSVGQRAAELPAIKVGGLQKIQLIGLARAKQVRIGPIGRIFFLPPTLTAGNSSALWPTETYTPSLVRSKPFLLTQSLFKSLAALISVHRTLISTVLNNRGAFFVGPDLYFHSVKFFWKIARSKKLLGTSSQNWRVHMNQL